MNVQYAAALEEIDRDCRRYPHANLLVAGDFNARVRTWESNRTDIRGELLQEFAASLGLTCENVRSSPTFQSVLGESVIDFTLSRLTAGRRVSGWRVDEDCYTGSDHIAIAYTIHSGGSVPRATATRNPEGWSLRKLDTGKLVSYIREEISRRQAEWLGTDPDAAAASFHQYVWRDCDLSMPGRSSVPRHRPAYWWNEEIAAKRRDCIRRRGLFQRADAGSGDREQMRVELQRAKKSLRKAIRTSQEKAWKELLNKVEADVWGHPYKIVNKKLNRCQPGAYTKGRELEMAAQLFPKLPATKWNKISMTGPHGFPLPVSSEEEASPFTIAELVRANGKLPGGKAPGPDAVLNEILKIFIKEDPDALLSLFNVCWREATFPD